MPDAEWCKRIAAEADLIMHARYSFAYEILYSEDNDYFVIARPRTVAEVGNLHQPTAVMCEYGDDPDITCGEDLYHMALCCIPWVDKLAKRLEKW